MYCFLFLRVLECFTSPGALRAYARSLVREGFPHSEILGYNGCLAPYRGVSPPCCVLHRFLEPRHPPYALNIPVRNIGNHNVFCLSLSVLLVLIAEFEKYVFASRDVRPKRPQGLGPKTRIRDDAVAYAPSHPTYHRRVVHMHLRDMKFSTITRSFLSKNKDRSSGHRNPLRGSYERTVVSLEILINAPRVYTDA